MSSETWEELKPLGTAPWDPSLARTSTCYRGSVLRAPSSTASCSYIAAQPRSWSRSRTSLPSPTGRTRHGPSRAVSTPAERRTIPSVEPVHPVIGTSGPTLLAHARRAARYDRGIGVGRRTGVHDMVDDRHHRALERRPPRAAQPAARPSRWPSPPRAAGRARRSSRTPRRRRAPGRACPAGRNGPRRSRTARRTARPPGPPARAAARPSRPRPRARRGGRGRRPPGRGGRVPSRRPSRCVPARAGSRRRARRTALRPGPPSRPPRPGAVPPRAGLDPDRHRLDGTVTQRPVGSAMGAARREQQSQPERLPGPGEVLDGAREADDGGGGRGLRDREAEALHGARSEVDDERRRSVGPTRHGDVASRLPGQRRVEVGVQQQVVVAGVLARGGDDLGAGRKGPRRAPPPPRRGGPPGCGPGRGGLGEARSEPRGLATLASTSSAASRSASRSALTTEPSSEPPPVVGGRRATRRCCAGRRTCAGPGASRAPPG